MPVVLTVDVLSAVDKAAASTVVLESQASVTRKELTVSKAQL